MHMAADRVAGEIARLLDGTPKAAVEMMAA